MQAATVWINPASTFFLRPTIMCTLLCLLDCSRWKRHMYAFWDISQMWSTLGIGTSVWRENISLYLQCISGKWISVIVTISCNFKTLNFQPWMIPGRKESRGSWWSGWVGWGGEVGELPCLQLQCCRPLPRDFLLSARRSFYPLCSSSNYQNKLAMTCTKTRWMWEGNEMVEITIFGPASKLLWAQFGNMFLLASHSITVLIEQYDGGSILEPSWVHSERTISIPLKTRPYETREESSALRILSARLSERSGSLGIRPP